MAHSSAGNSPLLFGLCITGTLLYQHDSEEFYFVQNLKINSTIFYWGYWIFSEFWCPKSRAPFDPTLKSVNFHRKVGQIR